MILNKRLPEDITAYEKSVNLLDNGQCLFIPKNVDKLLKLLIYKKELVEIHNDRKLAIEYCLVFLANFASVQTDYNNQDKWKALSTDILKIQIPGLNGSRYLKVIKFLLKPIFPFSPMIEVKKNIDGKDTYRVGDKSKQFRLVGEFLTLEFIPYMVKSEILMSKRREQRAKDLNFSLENPIVKNLLTIYPRLTLPSLQEIKDEAIKLSNENYITSKGKLLTYMNGRKKSNFVKFETRRVSHLDCVKSYKYLTANGLLVPVVSGERGGGRVCDSFNMMPSFIRNLIKIDNENSTILDFKCFHPNLCMKLYGGTLKNLTHQNVANELKLDLKKVKKEHLSFFNLNEEVMKLSPLFKYYEKYELKMLNNLLADKREFGHKITSTRMLNLEVEVITECIKRLNELNIYPLYIFDALMVKISNKSITKTVMNAVVKDFGIFTSV
jgi:hypothetical protein